MADAPSVPSYADVLWPTVKALRALGGSGSITEIVEKVANLSRHSPLPAVTGPGTVWSAFLTPDSLTRLPRGRAAREQRGSMSSGSGLVACAHGPAARERGPRPSAP